MNKRGLTLIEVLVVTVFFVMLIVAVLTSTVEMRSSFQAAGTATNLQEEARLTLNSITSDLKNSSISTVTITTDTPVDGTDRLKFQLPQDVNGDGVPDLVNRQIVWDPVEITVELEEDGAGMKLVKSKMGAYYHVLSENVKSIRFEDDTTDASLYPGEIRIIMEMEKDDARGGTDNFTVNSTVNLRI